MISPIFLFPSFFLLILTNMLVVQAGDLLIPECQNAKAPATCMACLNSAPQTDITNPVKIATALVGCMDSHATYLTEHISKLVSVSPVKGLVKGYEECGKNLVSTKTFLTDAHKNLETGDYHGANIAVLSAFKSAAQCEVQLANWWGSVNIVPVVVKYKIRVLEELCDAAISVIGHLKGVSVTFPKVGV